jgi:predicted HTH domain antitoxin
VATIEIDDEVYEALQLPEGERSEVLKRELAVSLYAQDVLSFGKARALAGLSAREFQRLLGEREVPRHYGEVELGEADRRSDIDLWVLVEEDRMAAQRTANEVRQGLEAREFDTGRYEYEIDVESLPAVPGYTDELREILSDGLVLHSTGKFETVQGMILHDDLDE